MQINKNKIKQNFSKLFFLETIWNVRSAIGTGSGLGTPARLSAVLVLFVGRRYYLRPIILWNHLEPFGTAAGYWNAADFSLLFSATGPPAGLIAATHVRVCDGNAMNVR